MFTVQWTGIAVFAVVVAAVGVAAQPYACASSPCANGGTCYDAYNCNTLHSNITGFVSLPPFGGSSAFAPREGYSVCISPNGFRFGVISTQEGVISELGYLRIFNTTSIATMTNPEAILQITPGTTSPAVPIYPVRCHWSKDSKIIIIPWNYIPAGTVPSDVQFGYATSGIVMAYLPNPGNWSLQYLLGSSAASTDASSQPIYSAMPGSAMYIYLGRPTANGGAGSLTIFGRQGTNYVWTQIVANVTTASSIQNAGRFGAMLLPHETQPIVLVGAPNDVSLQGLVYNISFDPILGTIYGNASGIPPPASILALSATLRWGIRGGASSDLSTFVITLARYGAGSTQGGDSVCTAFAGVVSCTGLLLPPLNTNMYKTAPSTPIGYPGSTVVDYSGTRYCSSDPVATGNGTAMNGVVICKTFNTVSGGWELDGDIITDGLGAAPTSRFFGYGMDFTTNMSIPNPLMAVGAPYSAAGTQGGFYVFANGNTSCVNSTVSRVFSCSCPTGYLGSSCQTVDPCFSQPCQHTGTCTSSSGVYSCACAAGYSGSMCQTNVNECASTPCQNTGNCTDLLNGFSCACAAGYSGLLCQTNANECASTPCQNSGTCSDLVNGFSCACASGYSGFRCQTNINECSSLPCANGAACVDGLNGFSCSCVAGYSGILCQTNVNECASAPCISGSVCADGINQYTCMTTVPNGGVVMFSSTTSNYSTIVIQFNGANATSNCTIDAGSAVTTSIAGLSYAISQVNQCVSIVKGTRGARLKLLSGVTRIVAGAVMQILGSVTLQTTGSSSVVMDSGSSVFVGGGSTLNLSGSASIIAHSTITGSGSLILDGVTLGGTGQPPDLSRFYGLIDPTQLTINNNGPAGASVQFNNFSWTGDLVLSGNTVNLWLVFAQVPAGDTARLNTTVCGDTLNGTVYIGSNATLAFNGDCAATVADGTTLTVIGSSDGTSILDLGDLSSILSVTGTGHLILQDVTVYSQGGGGISGDGILSLLYPTTVVSPSDSLSAFTGTTLCTPGFAGAACQTDINECVSSPCPGGSTCVDGINAFSCIYPPGGTACRLAICKSGYTDNGQQCTADPCSLTPCDPNGFTPLCVQVGTTMQYNCMCADPTLSFCTDGCYNLQTDLNNCNTCGNVCDPNCETCNGSAGCVETGQCGGGAGSV